ncbi:ParB N-terminal domain-containing protein [Sinimarinibacterium flocculans]|uniref:ParB N-terminal domain-containing protein n=1 Tax=Sinimarinibacterium flocculans TaxID=985250 RepID=UPI003C712C99
MASLHLDSKNPRLGRETSARAPREIIQYLFEHDKAIEIARSIATRGFFSNEPLLAVKEDERLVVVEGNRRLAALKALKEPGLLEGAISRQVERLSRQIEDINALSYVPVTVAPSRRATDKQLAGRHIGTPVLPWQAENRASFILDKLAEGYTNAQLQDQLGFSLSDIQSARQTRAIADMARSLELPDEIKAKIENPRAKLFTTLERIFDSSVGRDYLMIEPDAEYGIRGRTTKDEFLKGFRKVVADIALGRESSRSLNKNEDIRKYFESWKPEERPSHRRGSFRPVDVIGSSGEHAASRGVYKEQPEKKVRTQWKTVIPRGFKIRYGNDRLVDIRKELVRLKRDNFPNSGAVMLRVFFELSALHYLERTGELSRIVKKIESDQGRRLPHGVPTMRHLTVELTRIAKERLKKSDAVKVEKAIRYDESAPFSISELHGFVHGGDLPSPRDILQFWTRTEPLFRLMLEQDDASSGAV